MATATKKKSGSSRSSRSKSSSSSSGSSQSSQSSPASKLKDWPKKGGGLGQPWDPDVHQVDTGRLKVDEQADAMPVRPEHNKPILTSGAGGSGDATGDAVRELGQRLGELGYPNSVTDGSNPFSIYDQSIEAAVAAFCREYDVQEDPSGFGGHNPSGEANASRHTGPWTWEAVIRASDRERGVPTDDLRQLQQAIER